MTTYSIAKADGGVIVLEAAPGKDPAGIIAKWPPDVRALVANPVSIIEVPRSDVPKDRTYRDAWMFGSRGEINTDMTRARDIHKDRLRELREPKLAALDIEYTRADGRGDAAEKARIEAERQKLRDIRYC